ncbi:MAG: tRNA (adenosine(37)-N6)-threonylcarbamoyltransferase complex dimerization subunit type 1 TsaB [Solirubrobacterales bacterium]|nr:tRNA (adenosine(37)-N6)-threonylcarbamoyltransferase complex dimerization subunit type 1 TsaB [Solirubrobacterales bacterium]
MRILGLDTATRATTVAWLDTETGAAVGRRDDPPRGARPRHTPRLMGLVVETLQEAGVDWDGVDRIAVGVGPGTFTGLRIGIATARALAIARAIPIVGVCTLRALAGGAALAACEHGRAALAVLDARRGEAFAAGWSTPSHDPEVMAAASPSLRPAALAPDEFAAALRAGGGRWLAVGEGAVAFRTTLERAGVLVASDGSALHRVGALSHCRLASALEPEAPHAVRPAYLRRPDAEIALRARERDSPMPSTATPDDRHPR